MAKSKAEILAEIKDYLGFSKDSEFSNYLGIKRNVLSNWKTRDTFDAELLYTKCGFLNAEVLLGGEGELIKTKSTEKLTLSKGKEKSKEIDKKRNLQKSLPLTSIEKSVIDLQNIISFNLDKGNIDAPLNTNDKQEDSLFDRVKRLEQLMEVMVLKAQVDEQINEIEDKDEFILNQSKKENS